MNVTEPSTAVGKREAAAGVGEHPTSPDMAVLFFNTCLALGCGRLRLKPRERQLALVLAVESFGKNSASGVFDTEKIWERLGPPWRRNELVQMLDEWRRACWIGVDAVEYRLAPDRLPGWADVWQTQKRTQAGSGDAPELALRADDHVASVASELSQERACEVVERDAGCVMRQAPEGGGAAKFSHRSPDNCEIFAPQPLRNVSERLIVETSERLNVKNVERCETFADRDGSDGNQGSDELRRRVRAFVGESDWGNPSFWNSGMGWRGLIFTEEGGLLEAALKYLQVGIASGEITVRKTRGAALWEQFQRERRVQQKNKQPKG